MDGGNQNDVDAGLLLSKCMTLIAAVRHSLNELASRDEAKPIGPQLRMLRTLTEQASAALDELEKLLMKD